MSTLSYTPHALKAAAIALVVLAVVTCGDGPTEPPPVDRTPVALVASHDSLVLSVGDSAWTWFEARDAQAALVVPPGAVWASLDAAVASVSAGKVRALAQGQARVTITLGALADTMGVRVLPAIDATALTLKGDTLFAIGARAALQATSASGPDAREGRYTFLSRDEAVVVVENAYPWGSASARAVARGEAWVVATEKGGTADSVLVMVRPAAATLSFATETVGGFRGRSVTPAFTGTDANGNAVTSPDVVLRVLDTTVARPGAGASLQLLKAGFTRVDATSAIGARASAELIVRPFPKISTELLTRGINFPVAQLGTGQIATSPVSTDGPLAEPVMNTTIVGDPALTAEGSVTPSGMVTYVGVQPGDAKVIVSSPLMEPDTVTVHVTASRIHMGDSLPVLGVGANRVIFPWLADSARNVRELPANVTVTTASSDSTVVRVSPTTRSIEIDRLRGGGMGVELTGMALGTARITASAPGFLPAVIDYVVSAQPRLMISPPQGPWAPTRPPSARRGTSAPAIGPTTSWSPSPTAIPPWPARRRSWS